MTDPRDLVTTRLLDAPQELVFDAFTDPTHLDQWWGPRGFTTQTTAFTPGQQWRFTMVGPDGTRYANRITWKEVTRPARMVYEHDADTDAADDPHRFLTTVTFEARGQRTWLTMTARFASIEARAGAEKFGATEGGRQTLDRFEEHLAARAQPVPSGAFETTRVLHAARDLVFTVWTDPLHLSKWFAPAGCTTEVLTHELRPGGLMHYRQSMPGGQFTHGASVYREIVRPERLVFVQGFADDQARPARHPMSATWPLHTLTTITLTELGDHTLLRLRWVPHEATAEERATFEGALAGMAAGWAGTFVQLDAYLSTLRRA
jgi:uncharacterized protein YndB with AHSA1/START domain